MVYNLKHQMSNSSDDFVLPSSQELKIAAEAENSKCENMRIGDSNSGESEKENDNGRESFKSSPKVHRSSMVVLNTEEEMKYRHKYFKDESEVVTHRMLRCTACCTNLQAVVLEGRDIYHHPVLRVLMCRTCVGFYGDGNFSVDEDGSDKYCRWCGQGGTLYCCSTCSSAFCKSCIKRNLNRSILSDIESEDWQCFVCNGKPLWELRAVCVNARAYSEKIRRNKQRENHHKLKQMQKKQKRLKCKSQQSNHWQKSSSPDTSSDDDSYSNKKRESSKNRHKQNNGSQLDSRKKHDEKDKMKDSDSECVIMDKEITKRKIECVQLSDSERSEKEEENGSVALSDSGENSDNEEEISDNSKKKERHQEKSKRRLKLNVKKGKRNSRVAMGTEEKSKAKPEQEAGHSNGGTTEGITDKKLPKELDEKTAKLACDWLEEHGKELAIVGETLALRARRYLEKKVCLKAMTDPENVDKVVSSLQLLMKLAGENLEQIGGFLSLHHKYWIKRVIRHRSSKTCADVSNSNQRDYEGKTKKCITEQSKDGGSVSVIGLGGEDVGLKSHTENQYDNIGIESKETDTQEREILSADSIMSTGVRSEDTKKRKLVKEGSESDDREVNTVEDEGNLQKSVIDKKRRKLEDVLEMEADPKLDITVNDTESSENCKGDNEFSMKRSNEQTDVGLEGVSEEKTVKVVCPDVTEDAGNMEVDEVSERKMGMEVDSSENEEATVAEHSVKDMNLLHGAADKVVLSETSNSGNSSTLYEEDKFGKSFESVSTLSFVDHKDTLSECVVAEIHNAQDKSVDSMEEVMQENQSKNSDEPNYENSDAESEGNSADVAAISEGNKNKENEKVSNNESESSATTIEYLSGNACEKSISGEVSDNGKNERVNSFESLDDDLMPSVKRQKVDREVDTNEHNLVTLEISDNVENDPIATAHADVSAEDIKELEIQKCITEKNEYSIETNKMDTHEDLEKDSEKECGEKEKLESDDEGESSDKVKLEMSDVMSECEGQQKGDEKDKVKLNEENKSSDVGELEMCDDISKCESERKDGEKVKVEINEGETIGENIIKEGTVVNFRYTEECIRAQQTLLEYTTDDDSSCTDTTVKKKKRKEHSRKAKQEGIATCKDITSVKKRVIGPKSRTQKYRESTSSLSSETDESESSMGRQHRNVDKGRKKKFRLKDTEAYKQDEKLRCNCTVNVEHLPDEVFQKHYEQYYSDGDEESEKNIGGDNEIDSLINLRSLKKARANKYDTGDSDAEDSSDVGTTEARRRPKKNKKKEEEQRLIDFFNQMEDADDDSMSSGASDSEQEAIKALKIKKSLLEKENEMAMKLLLGSSTDDDNGSCEKQDELEQEKEKDKKAKVKTEDVSKEEEEEKNKTTEADADPLDDDISSSDSQKALKQKKEDWRKNKLLTERLSDLDTSDEERRWKTKKEKEQKETDKKKRVRRRILGSDDDSDVIVSSSDHSSSGEIFVKKRKKPLKKSNSDKNSTSDSDAPREVKRKRIRAPARDSSSSVDDQVESSQKSDATGKGRKKIHRIMKDENVGEATRRAAREEEERKKRILEKQKLYNEIYREVEGIEKFDKLVLDFDPETKEELISVDPYLVSKLKPHQVKGVKFMWDACFESLKQIEKTKGSGCILAHCMGLGKTFQIVTLVHTLLKHKDTKMHTVLVVCPLSTVLNWVSEFNMWLKDIGDGEDVNVFELSKYKQNYERMYQLKEWHSCGGVMVLGYDMFRNLTNTQAKRIRKNALETFQSTLVDPGPDLVVCDEGHMLKNEDTALAKAMRRIRTLRRIVLTGTPLQNNLKEYHCMVQFVKPNLLGTRKEFLNRFVNPISNGQFEDSTAHDVKIMKRRAHVLHKMLEGSVQRFDYSVLTPFLPPKHEYVISIRLSEVQIKAYRYYLEHYAVGISGEKTKGAQLFNDFQNLSRIWTHPRVLQMNADKAEKTAERKHMESDSEGSLRDFIDDDDDDNDETTKSSGSSSSDESDVQGMTRGAGSKSKPTNRITRRTRSQANIEEPEASEADKDDDDGDEKTNPLSWWKQFTEGDELENMKYSGKLVLLFSILRECEKIGDKALVFSQSLSSLNLIEYFLQCPDTATQEKETEESLGNNASSWTMGLDYFRLDGSTSVENRNIWCKAFNREDNHRARLFIISTRAGGLGINLYAANRVIIFDASWNPSHDVQSIFRVYRFGQKKPCYIYRFLAQGTMEEKIYDRQVTKLSLSCRVVDEQQIERHYNMADLQELYRFNPEQKTKRPTPILPKDRLLAELLKEHEEWIVTYHEHESLLENKEEEELNEEERKAAWEEYESEKKGKIIPPVTGPPTLNMAALREIIRKENPQATEEQLELQLKMVANQLYEYLNSPNGMQAPNFQLQALQQYRIHQEQLIRAQQQEQWRLQQENALRNAANFNNSVVTFKQYIQDQTQTNQNTAVYPTNLYRNIAKDKSGVLRLQPKRVPFNPPSTSYRTMLQSFDGSDAGGNQVVSRQPVILPMSRPSTSMMPPPIVYSGNRGNQLQEMTKHYKRHQPMGGNTAVPEDVIETID
ncbi:transcriptional regulator ATRX isoform X3 [Cryptotermes secundus]|uniref:transcriptional regulator ATRX isoform X3 n=1 Tax=Cryptotermes secundus TaxID=105785 RepID=UPI000CD7B928|nr:transcriptional regulator ATRX isoform X3 [Cryptotermes secundus]